ncbi:helix-turn-helix transcriptional regulator [Neobacillus sp. YIM B02564]|uniref:Helix-turn-helix transcriptional regulator n=2 Tax=Neobacillus paridis TaxID=2803862 RepID=A0ABS1TL97_9BACI|nr:helix-turn-helix transcriptional regulator [Neobacillus paridis]
MMTALYESRTPLHGRNIQTIIKAKSGNLADIPSSALYPVLAGLEKEGFIVGEWEKRDDPKKRHRRFYAMTLDGERRYRSLKKELQDVLESYLGFMKHVLTYASQHLSKEDGEEYKLNLQSLLSYLTLAFLHEPNYAFSLKKQLEQTFGFWEVSEGTLYPLLSELEMKGLIRSYWGHVVDGKPVLMRKDKNSPPDEPQTRLVRFYEATPKGALYQKTYGRKFLSALEEACTRAQFTCDYVYNHKPLV